MAMLEFGSIDDIDGVVNCVHEDTGHAWLDVYVSNKDGERLRISVELVNDEKGKHCGMCFYEKMG